MASASFIIIIMRTRCARRYSTAGTSRPLGLPPPRASFIFPARAYSSKNTSDSTPSPLTFTGTSGTDIGTNFVTPIDRSVSSVCSAFFFALALVSSSNDSLM